MLSTERMLDDLALRLEPRPPPDFLLPLVLFEKQLTFGQDQSRRQTAVCTRRAGKTYACAAKLIDCALRRPGSVALYITLSRINAKRIVWETLLDLVAKHQLAAEVRVAELCIALRNGSRIFLSGASDASEVEKFRGLALSVVIIDEAQSFPGYLEKLVNDVLSPALMDYAGAVVLMGTPGPVPVGYYHKCAHSEHWSHHGWSVFDNPHIEKKGGKSPQILLDEELRARGVDKLDPSIRREWFGQWSLDTNSLVFRFDAERNTVLAGNLPRLSDFVIGVDLGFDDADAIAVLGWSDASPNLYLIEERVLAKQNVSALIEQVKALYEKYQPHAVVADTGGLGKKIADEIQTRTSIPVEAAEKERKNEHIELLNDALRTGHFLAQPGSRFGQDCMLVEWDKSNPEKWKISERFHSDICDAVLYAYRRAQHWLHVPVAKPQAVAAVNSPEWLEAQHKEVEEMFEKQLNENERRQQEEAEPMGGDDLMDWL